MPDKPPPSPKEPDHLRAYRQHPRQFRGSQIIYPVLSRRSEGISIGVNLSQEKLCNFNCRYCQVDRRGTSDKPTPHFSLDNLESELRQTLQTILTGRIYQHQPFDKTPAPLRRLNDIALSGDGEPSLAPEFLPACEICARVKDDLELDHVKIILITNATGLHLPPVIHALEILDAHQGQIWAKLDAGSEDYFKFINQTTFPFLRILDNLLVTARRRPIIIQSLFTRLDGRRVPYDEIAAYAHRLEDIRGRGGRIDAIQLCTIARPPRDPRISPLTRPELDQIAGEITDITDIPLKKFYH